MHCQIVLIALTRSALDLAGKNLPPDIDSDFRADGCGVDGCTVSIELDSQPFV